MLIKTAPFPPTPQKMQGRAHHLSLKDSDFFLKILFVYLREREKGGEEEKEKRRQERGRGVGGVGR